MIKTKKVEKIKNLKKLLSPIDLNEKIKYEKKKIWNKKLVRLKR